MRMKLSALLLWALVLATVSATPAARQTTAGGSATLLLPSPALRPAGAAADARSLVVDGLFYETAQGRVALGAALTETARDLGRRRWTNSARMPDGRLVTATVVPQGRNFTVTLRAEPAADIVRWGIAIGAVADEYFTGLMERVVDGPQQASWAPGITQAMNLRGQVVDMIVKPTTSVYAPFYLSSRGYAAYVRSNWPGKYDFAAGDPTRVRLELEGPSFEVKIYTAADPATLVRQHALEAGPPVLPPRWVFRPWRWRDEHTQRTAYFDGTRVTAPFNAEVVEDVVMMTALGIPYGVYWIDRPYGPGPLGFDDFEIDPARLPNFARMVRWLESRQAKTMMWIAPFFQGRMAVEATARGYTLAGQVRPASGNNFPMVDLTNPAARSYWQDGVAKLLKAGVAGFKLDRAEENIPESGNFKVFDGRSIRENRNAYVAMYAKAVHEIATRYRGSDFVAMPRAAYDGSSPYAAFWGGDIGGTQEGLRASIVALQRSAIMGYPVWGSDTCGYNQQLLEQEVCARWLAFSAFSPIMEVGPTRNVGFWNLPREPRYDEVLIATWRLYARLHERLTDYSYRHAREARATGMPIVRPLLMIDPSAPDAWTNWWTYLYGRDLVVSPIWEKGKRTQQVYLPAGSRWRDAWRPAGVFAGGQTVTVEAEPHQMPLFVRVGATVPIGDLNAEWQAAQAAARTRPDLRALDAAVAEWFERTARE